MWLMLQQDEPEDFVVATGEGHSVREFVEKSFACVGREDQLLGDSTKIRQKLGWKPRVTFYQLVEEMVSADLELMKRNPEA